MKNAVCIAELIRPGRPALLEMSEASIAITFSFFSAIMLRIAFGMALLKSSTVLHGVLSNNIE